MLARLKALFVHTCPSCKQTLIIVHDSVCSTKHCPNGHYKEESYHALGVRVVYDGRSSAIAR